MWKGHIHYLKLPPWTLHTALPLPFQGEDFARLPQRQENAAFSVITLLYAWTKERIVADVSNLCYSRQSQLTFTWAFGPLLPTLFACLLSANCQNPVKVSGIMTSGELVLRLGVSGP